MISASSLDFNLRSSPTPQVNAAQSSLWCWAFALSQPTSDGWFMAWAYYQFATARKLHRAVDAPCAFPPGASTSTILASSRRPLVCAPSYRTAATSHVSYAYISGHRPFVRLSVTRFTYLIARKRPPRLSQRHHVFCGASDSTAPPKRRVLRCGFQEY